MQTNIVKSTCRMCHGGCQVRVVVEDGQVKKVLAAPDSPVSKGFICPKGMATPELLYHPDRLISPLKRVGKRGNNNWESISWDEALEQIAEKLTEIKNQNGPEYFAMLHGTTRPYTDFANRFADAYGTPNFTHVGHICYVPRVMASVFTIGSQQLPMVDVYGFDGIAPKCLVVWGCNAMELGTTQGVNGHMDKKALGSAEKTIIIDPRKTKTAAKATHWLQIRPGTDGALALAMIHVMIAENLVDHHFIHNYTIGFEALKEHVQAFSPAWAEPITGISKDQIIASSREIAKNAPAGILWGSPIDQSLCSFQTARAILILSAITGNIDRPGSNIICTTPEKVKMKSQFVNREIQRTMHMPFRKYGRILDSQQKSSLIKNTILGLLDFAKSRNLEKLVKLSAKGKLGKQIGFLNRLKKSRFPLSPMLHQPSLWSSIVRGKPYRIKGLWILGSNPLVTQSDPNIIKDALGKLEFIVVSDYFLTPTAQYADIVLPTSTWLEQDDVVNTFEQWCVTSRKKVAQVGKGLDDREVIIKLAQKLGLTKAFPWKTYHDFLDWMLSDTDLSLNQFQEEGIISAKMKYKKYEQSGFNTPSGKLELYSEQLKKMGVSPLPIFREPAISPTTRPDLAKRYPLILTSAKSKHYFHSEGRQINSLRNKNPNPIVEINPQTADTLGIKNDSNIWIENQHGRIKMKAKYYDGIAEDTVCAQYGWWFPEATPPVYDMQLSSLNQLFKDQEYDPDIGSESLRSQLCKVYPAN